MHCNRNTTSNGNLVYLLMMNCDDVGQKCCFPLREEHEFTSSFDVLIFSLNTSVSRKDLHVSARHKLMFPLNGKQLIVSSLRTSTSQLHTNSLPPHTKVSPLYKSGISLPCTSSSPLCTGILSLCNKPHYCMPISHHCTRYSHIMAC